MPPDPARRWDAARVDTFYNWMRNGYPRGHGEPVPPKFEYLTDLAVLADQSANAKQELWWPLLLAALCVLMSEHVLAWWFGTRG